ncbi:hypothetical protein OPAG_00940 [Rhodococcus opacus PD630]|nr:hypothetical protein Pd630_LPD06571 [Rhodococcus opacus PD630]EHI40318.1 hypothetical protein OPAG_00940 [Rhodococcus opacus PD630]
MRSMSSVRVVTQFVNLRSVHIADGSVRCICGIISPPPADNDVSPSPVRALVPATSNSRGSHR